MKTNNNIPAYRFQGYTDAWELRRIFEIADRFDNLRIPIASSLRVPGSTPYYGANGIQDYVEGYTHDGEFVLVAEDGANDLKNYPVNLVNGKIWVNNHAHVLQGKENIANNNFLSYSINRANIEVLLVGGGRAKLNSDVLMDIELEIPSLPEQEAIGTFFSTLDQHITLHQRKLDTLKEQKKTYLKLLFPAKGQTKPALRFQGFEDDWEVKRISDIGDIVTGNTPSTSNEDYYSKEGMMWVTPTDIDGLIITDTNKKLSPEGEKVSRIVPANSILVTCIASIGKNTLLFEAGSFNQQINAVVPNQSFYHPYFLLTQSYFWSESMKRIAPAATMQIINKSEFSNITVPLPSLPEQEAIGTFFQTLDQEISQVEDKLASLKELKKTLLRKLFV